jgi:hypothetical protein
MLFYCIGPDKKISKPIEEKPIKYLVTCMEPISLGFIFHSLLNIAPLRLVLDNTSAAVNFFMFVIYFSSKITTPNLRPEDSRELLAAIFKLLLDMSP